MYIDEVLGDGTYKVGKRENGVHITHRCNKVGTVCEEATMTTPFSTQLRPASAQIPMPPSFDPGTVSQANTR